MFRKERCRDCKGEQVYRDDQCQHLVKDLLAGLLVERLAVMRGNCCKHCFDAQTGENAFGIFLSTAVLAKDGVKN